MRRSAQAQPAQEPEPLTDSQHQSVKLWVTELADQLEVQAEALNIAELSELAQQARRGVNDHAVAPTAYLIGYVTASLEAQGVADAAAVQRAALRVTERLLQRRERAVG